MSKPVVAIVHLRRSSGLGGRRRVESWSQIFRAAGAEAVLVPVTAEDRARVSLRGGRDVLDLGRGHLVPEALSWAADSVRLRVESLRPTVVVLVTARAYRPVMATLAPTVVLDFIDRLSVSYEQRSSIVDSPLARLGYRSLAPLHRRFESARDGNVRRVAAGWSDAAALGATWVPITADPLPVAVDGRPADHDLVFSGTLSYPSNIEALERLAGLWPALCRRRPGVTAVIAGASPAPRVTALAAEHGWALMADFGDLADVLRRARIAVVPLVHAAGIQIKVLDAAAHGMAQVVTPVALAGFRPGFPATVASGDDELVDAIATLLDDDTRRRQEGSAAREYVGEHYSTEAWSPWATALLER